MKLIEVSIPSYTIDKAPDDRAIGAQLDQELVKHFAGKKVLIRGIASSEHPDKTVDELIAIITQTGTDRYDANRSGDRYENIANKPIDLFAFPAEVSQEVEVFHQMIWGFYHSALGIHGRPMRIDIASIYDAEQMKQVSHQYEGRDDIKHDGFLFKHSANKTGALLGIIKIS